VSAVGSSDGSGGQVAASSRPTHIVVVGLGNLIRTDDGIGVHAVRRVAGSPRLPSDPSFGIAFVDGGTRGPELVNDAADASHLLILDAIDADAPPGTLISLSGADLADLPPGYSVHQLGIVDWITALAMLTGRVPEIRVLGLQPADTGWGTELTAAMQPALERLVDAALAQIEAWTRP
jgi:hydrogenase maturation protease